MAQRDIKVLVRKKITTGGNVPSDALMGEPFINLYDGIMKFSGVTGGGFLPAGSETNVFEVGSSLTNQQISNDLTIGSKITFSGAAGLLTKYQNTSGAGLVGKMLSGTSTGFVLADISSISSASAGSSGDIQYNNGSNGFGAESAFNYNSTTNTLLVDNTRITTNLSAATIYLGSTDINTVISNSITANGAHVQNGTNTTTGGTLANPTINVVASPSFNSLTTSGQTTINSNLTVTGNTSAKAFSATSIFLGSTDINTVISNSVTANGAHVQNGTNTTTGGTLANPTINVVASPSFTNLTVSGNTSATTLSATTIYLGSTDINTVISNSITANGAHVQNGTNTTTGGTLANPTVNVVASPSFNSLTTSGQTTINSNLTVTGNTSAKAFSATSIFLGSTDINTVISNSITANGSHVQNGLNTTTGGTLANPTINVVDSPIFTNLTVSGNTSATTLSATTIYLGGVDLNTTIINGSSHVQNGRNTTTGGTAALPTVNIVDSPSFTNIYSSGLTTNNVLYAGSNGLLTGESAFSYASNTDTLTVGNINVASDVSIYGRLLVFGDVLSAMTSELYIEDNRIALNYNPTGSTAASSLGAGIYVQDGSGIQGTDVFWDIRGTNAGTSSRSLTTNLANIRVNETGTYANPNGVYVLTENNILDGGTY